MKFFERPWRVRFSLALLLGLMIPCAILAALFAREWQWHRFRARELAKLNTSLNPHYDGPDYAATGATPPTGFLPWLLGEHYVAPVTKLNFVSHDHPLAFIAGPDEGLVLRKGDEHLLDFGAIPELEELVIMPYRNQFQIDSARALSQLRRLHFLDIQGDHAVYQTDPLLREYVQALPSMPQLTIFHAANEAKFLESQYLPLLLEKAPHLTELNLSLCRLDAPAIAALRVPQPWTKARLLLWESAVDPYCAVVQAMLNQKQLTELTVENYRYGSLHFPQVNNEYVQTPDFLAYRQFEAEIPASQQELQLRDSALTTLTLNYVPRLSIANNAALAEVKIEDPSGEVRVRDCPLLWFLEANAQRVEVEGCPKLTILRTRNARTIELRKTAPIETISFYSLDEMILGPESQGVEELEIANFSDAEATTRFMLPMIPALKRVELHRLNAGLVASLAKQTGPLEIMLDLGPNSEHEDWGYDPAHYAEFWKRVKIGKLHLRFNCWELDLRQLFAGFEQCTELEELEIYGLHYLFSDPPNRKESLDAVTYEEAEKLWMLQLPPKVKKIKITRVLEHRPTAAVQQHPLVQFLKKKYPHIEVEFVPW